MPVVPTLNEKDFRTLYELSARLLEEDRLAVLGLKRPEEDEFKGFALVLKDKQRWILLKAACGNLEKADGAMYLLNYTMQEAAFEEGCIYDFGGSRVEGVRRFNKSFGSADVDYYHYEWNNAPLFYRIFKYFRDKWMKK